MATAEAVRTETFRVGHLAPHPKRPKQTSDSYTFQELLTGAVVRLIHSP
jgi:hypothetical protein